MTLPNRPDHWIYETWRLGICFACGQA
ncbi:hypothetical protein IL54_2992 [Sphingobium sp. ba1]|nr:hypothetical protein IL54_2992 [Sphingobium sp. ba1]